MLPFAGRVPSRVYGSDPQADVSAILKEVLGTGESGGWTGTPRRRSALTAILARYGIECIDAERGTWARKPFFGA